MPLIKDGRLAEDAWADVADARDLPVNAQPVVSLERWQSERESLLALGQPLGIRLRSDQSPALIAEDLDNFALIALEFPKFGDGRAYSYARLLRERYGFAGELRAVGNVLRDQFFFLHRCGFDAFEVPDAKLAEAWQQYLTEISVIYQPTADRRRTTLSLRQRRQLQVKIEGKPALAEEGDVAPTRLHAPEGAAL